MKSVHDYRTDRLAEIAHEIQRLTFEREILLGHAAIHRQPDPTPEQYSVWLVPVEDDSLLITSTKFDFDTMIQGKNVKQAGEPIGILTYDQGSARQLASFLHNRYRNDRGTSYTYPIERLTEIVSLLWFMTGNINAKQMINLPATDHGKRADAVRGMSWTDSFTVMCDQWDTMHPLPAPPAFDRVSELNSLFEKLKRA